MTKERRDIKQCLRKEGCTRLGTCSKKERHDGITVVGKEDGFDAVGVQTRPPFFQQQHRLAQAGLARSFSRFVSRGPPFGCCSG